RETRVPLRRDELPELRPGDVFDRPGFWVGLRVSRVYVIDIGKIHHLISSNLLRDLDGPKIGRSSRPIAGGYNYPGVHRSVQDLVRIGDHDWVGDIFEDGAQQMSVETGGVDADPVQVLLIQSLKRIGRVLVAASRPAAAGDNDETLVGFGLDEGLQVG